MCDMEISPKIIDKSWVEFEQRYRRNFYVLNVKRIYPNPVFRHAKQNHDCNFRERDC